MAEIRWECGVLRWLYTQRNGGEGCECDGGWEYEVAFTDAFGVVLVLNAPAKQTRSNTPCSPLADVSAYLARSGCFCTSCISP